MESVHTDTDRLTRMIGELLEVARIDTNRLSLHPRTVDPLEVVGRVVDLPTAGSDREIRVLSQADDMRLFVDPDRFTQVLFNLIENAVRHGEGIVTVSLLPTPGDPTRVTLLVEDEGEGIAPGPAAPGLHEVLEVGQARGVGLGMYIIHGLTVAAGRHRRDERRRRGRRTDRAHLACRHRGLRRIWFASVRRAFLD